MCTVSVKAASMSISKAAVDISDAVNPVLLSVVKVSLRLVIIQPVLWYWNVAIFELHDLGAASNEVPLQNTGQQVARSHFLYLWYPRAVKCNRDQLISTP